MNKGVFCTNFSNYELVRKQLFCKLVNPERQPEVWKELPFRPWLDLGLCCYYDMEMDGLPEASVTIRNNCLSLWDIRAEKVMADAWHNTADRQRVLFCPLNKVLNEMEEEFTDPKPFCLWEDSPLYILTNTNRIFGAVYMAVPGILKKVGNVLDGDFYIIPSSIHECLILPDTDMAEAEELNRLVRMVNREHVAENEILADHVYYYDRSLDAVRLC